MAPGFSGDHQVAHPEGLRVLVDRLRLGWGVGLCSLDVRVVDPGNLDGLVGALLALEHLVDPRLLVVVRHRPSAGSASRPT